MPAMQNSHLPQALYIHGTPTASPTFTPVTPSPSAATWPATSCPGMSGRVGSGCQSPSMACRSEWQTPQAVTLISTSPRPGVGIGTCSIRNLSPILCSTAAFMVFFIGPPNGSQR